MTSNLLATKLHDAAIMPILTVTDIKTTLLTVAALVDGGVKAVEIVLRTEHALEAIRLVRQAYPDLLTAAGTVMGPASFDRAVEAGAQLIIAPGLTASLINHHRANTIPMVPGAMTASEVMAAVDAGYSLLKYYPAVPSNGTMVLADYQYLFPNVLFMPTGKINLQVLPDFVRLKNVACVGGSWMYACALEKVSEEVRRALVTIEKIRDADGRL